MTIQQSRLRHQRRENKICKENKRKGIKSPVCETWETQMDLKGPISLQNRESYLIV